MSQFFIKHFCRRYLLNRRHVQYREKGSTNLLLRKCKSITMMSPDLSETMPLRSVLMVSVFVRPENVATSLVLGVVLKEVRGELPWRELSFLGLKRAVATTAAALSDVSPLEAFLVFSSLGCSFGLRPLFLTTLTSPRDVSESKVSVAFLSGVNFKTMSSFPCLKAAILEQIGQL